MKKLLLLLAVLALVSIFAFPVIAKGPSKQAGKSNMAHLYLYEKTGEPDWDIVPDGAWGKMTYELSGTMFDYVFNGHELVPAGDYTLVYYPDPWPGTGLKCLGSKIADEFGNVHIKNEVDTGTLPASFDVNFGSGAKIWLVETSDVQCEGATWSVVGTWKWSVLGTYLHDIMIDTQYPNGTFLGTGGYPAGADDYTYDEVITGQVIGNQITLTTVYSPGGYTATAIGTIASDGTISGTLPWSWVMTEGAAVSTGGKMIGWSPAEYLFEETLINFTQTP